MQRQGQDKIKMLKYVRNAIYAGMVILLVSCAEDIPDPLTVEDLFGMLSDDTAKIEQKDRELPVTITGRDGAPMVLIPAGEFEMGDSFAEGLDGELPVHTVYVDAFYMDKYEVTNAQYASFLNGYGKNTDAAGHKLLDIDDAEGDCLIEQAGNIYRPRTGYEAHPVIEVSWYGAAAYAQFYGKRLPTEAEWEKAARGGLTGKRYPWGDNLSHDNANYGGTGGKDKWEYTSPVGSFAPNGYGRLYDMAGNVYEWCADWYDKNYYASSPRQNPTGPGSGTSRVLRGGSWGSYSTYFLRVAYRNNVTPTATSHSLGFRCAGLSVTP